MRLTKLYVRFYKSFNYDYERKFARKSEPCEWECIDGKWFPYVRIALEPSITTIVGANESGKSHLLDAIEKLITGKEIQRGDFCRYSHFFSVQHGKRRLPDFAGDFELCTENDIELVKQHLDLNCNIGGRFRLLRENGASPELRILDSSSDQPVGVNDEDLAHVLPTVFRIAHVPLPDSIPLCELGSGVQNAPGSRRSRRSLIKKILETHWRDQNEFMQTAPELYALLSSDDGDTEQSGRQYDLGRSLLFDIAKIESSTFEDLAEAIADGREGYANGLIQRINDGLAEHLNFPRWWVQDREFKLLTAPREHDLVFTIRDRTGTDYSFSERSNGLKYFLSYHVQLLAHRPPKENQSEILLMDEPDAYLSNQGQQDLLKILERFARPEDGRRCDQIVYVTHSPFLINRNAGERVRVLDKGVTDEGTRVVKDVARNHYEPLRSSLGAFVAETSFIGGSNLFVEGLADQVLLAGLNSHLIATGTSRTTVLDLNDVTIVPAGSASNVPYLVFLARGRDVVRPPCVVLLDSDDAGDDAAKNLARGGPHRKELVPAEYVVQVGRWAEKAQLEVDDGVVVTELEDLVPLTVAVAAAKNYAIKIVGLDAKTVNELTVADVKKQLGTAKRSVFCALSCACTERLDGGFHIEKVGFAREIISLLADPRPSSKQPSGCDDLVKRFKLLLEHLAQRLRDAHRVEQERRSNNRLERAVAGFLRDHTTPTAREHAKLLVDEIDVVAGDSAEGDRLKRSADAIRRDFNLDENLTAPIDRYGDFLDRVKALRYAERFAKRAAGGDPVATRRDPQTDGVNSSDAKKKETDDSKARKKNQKKS